MIFIAKGFDTDSGRSVSTIKSIIVSSLPYVLGLKANGDLEYINQQDKRQIEFIAIDSEAKIDGHYRICVATEKRSIKLIV